MGPTEFGEKLRLERAGRQTTIEEIAVQSRVDLRYLEALERGDFAALPGRAIGKFYVRLYAEILGFEPEEWLVRYDRAQQQSRRPSLKSPQDSAKPPRPVEAAIARWRASLAAEREAEAAVEPEPAPAGPELEAAPALPEAVDEAEAGEPVPDPVRPPRAQTRPRWMAGLALLALTVAVWLGGAALLDRAPAVDRSQPVPRTAEVIDSAPSPSPSPLPDAAPVSPGLTDPGHLTVPEYAIGRAVENNRVVDPSDSFEEGNAAYFLTRVLGGSRGERIRHVWMREGRTVQSIELSLGATHWRTHSRKTLWGPGEWSVEVRDLDQRVLARVEFTCVPKS